MLAGSWLETSAKYVKVECFCPFAWVAFLSDALQATMAHGPYTDFSIHINIHQLIHCSCWDFAMATGMAASACLASEEDLQARPGHVLLNRSVR